MYCTHICTHTERAFAFQISADGQELVKNLNINKEVSLENKHS